MHFVSDFVSGRSEDDSDDFYTPPGEALSDFLEDDADFRHVGLLSHQALTMSIQFLVNLDITYCIVLESSQTLANFHYFFPPQLLSRV